MRIRLLGKLEDGLLQSSFCFRQLVEMVVDTAEGRPSVAIIRTQIER